MGNCFSPHSRDLRNDSFNSEFSFADSPWNIRYDKDTREDFGDSPWKSHGWRTISFKSKIMSKIEQSPSFEKVSPNWKNQNLTGWNIINDFLVEEYRKMACFGAKFHEIWWFWRQNLKQNQKSTSQNPSSKSEIGTWKP